MTKYIIAVIAASAAACTNVEPAPAGTGSAQNNAQQVLPDGSTIEAACSPPEGAGHPYTTVAELQQLIVGTWVVCAGPSLSTTANSVGMRFDATAAFTQLIGGDGFVTVAPNNFEYGGTWVTDPELAIDVTLVSSDWVAIETPAFEDGPRRFAQPSFDADGNLTESIYIAID
ncbi:MAG TPA: hypothetical protein VH143_13745 [Kofleriaceae bacterium]|jgi:hypothetical protein|nr:hypothetical protein [Kofleriaceae bacterium]